MTFINKTLLTFKKENAVNPQNTTHLQLLEEFDPLSISHKEIEHQKPKVQPKHPQTNIKIVNTPHHVSMGKLNS